ncbi:hypothetical protein DET65_3732 [Sunxiuqinia elliptica]|uniref:Uncharacterized protein n=1 Tax=Sunxiuqinia elliptica TaxID=655355 RepID=A0A4R6GYL2_9BACT|nr:hypothetical protein DET52_106168 [Sunxiuqinia elliptica]TDO57147.1 hypothetical protein DET65_3732 [Sunxiuqinia elliptica]
MLQIKIFTLEILTAFSVLKLTNDTLNELWNIALIVVLRLLFFVFERKLKAYKERRRAK